VDDGLYFLNSQNRRQPSVKFFSFATGQTTRVGTLPRAASSLGVRPGYLARSLVALQEEAEGDIILVQNFH
jgi:hypothetical protein